MDAGYWRASVQGCGLTGNGGGSMHIARVSIVGDQLDVGGWQEEPIYRSATSRVLNRRDKRQRHLDLGGCGHPAATSTPSRVEAECAGHDLGMGGGSG